jgi:hypothetical protein
MMATMEASTWRVDGFAVKLTYHALSADLPADAGGKSPWRKRPEPSPNQWLSRLRTPFQQGRVIE